MQLLISVALKQCVSTESIRADYSLQWLSELVHRYQYCNFDCLNLGLDDGSCFRRKYDVTMIKMCTQCADGQKQ